MLAALLSGAALTRKSHFGREREESVSDRWREGKTDREGDKKEKERETRTTGGGCKAEGSGGRAEGTPAPWAPKAGLQLGGHLDGVPWELQHT